MNVVFSAHAEKDLTDILDDLAEKNLAAATSLNAQFTQRLDQLMRLPEMGRPRSGIYEGLRGLLVSPYVLFYRLDADKIVVVRILHERRDLRQTLTDER